MAIRTKLLTHIWGVMLEKTKGLSYNQHSNIDRTKSMRVSIEKGATIT